MDTTLLFIGALVTAILQLVKYYVGMNRVFTLAVLVGLSLVAGAGSMYLQKAGLWESFTQIIISSAAIYAIIVKNLDITKK